MPIAQSHSRLSNGKLEPIQETPIFALLEPNKNANGVWVKSGELENGNWLHYVRKLERVLGLKQVYNLSATRENQAFRGKSIGDYR